MKIGDKIAVIDDDLRGIVTSVHGKTIVLQDEFGFTHHYPSDQVVLQNPDLYENITIEKKSEQNTKVSKKHNKNGLVLDLHFEKLIENPSKHNSFERLFIQKEKLLQTLEFCRKNKIKKLEIIHGIGDGVLQQMVHDTLESHANLEFHHNAVLLEQSGSVTVFL